MQLATIIESNSSLFTFESATVLSGDFRDNGYEFWSEIVINTDLSGVSTSHQLIRLEVCETTQRDIKARLILVNHVVEEGDIEYEVIKIGNAEDMCADFCKVTRNWELGDIDLEKPMSFLRQVESIRLNLSNEILFE